MSNIVNVRDICAEDLKAGDIALITVKVVVSGPQRYRIYRCSVQQNDNDGVPQGVRVNPDDERQLAEALFPPFAQAGEPDTW